MKTRVFVINGSGPQQNVVMTAIVEKINQMCVLLEDDYDATITDIRYVCNVTNNGAMYLYSVSALMHYSLPEDSDVIDSLDNLLNDHLKNL